MKIMEVMIKGKQRLTGTEGQRRVILIFMVVLCIVILISITAVPAFAGGGVGGRGGGGGANPGVDRIYTGIGLMAGWIAKIGLVVAFFGGIETVLSFASDNAEARIKGLKIMASGFILYGIVMRINDFI
ncbi:MAG: hypothetical protein PHC81_05790 [Clostridia bacterium]|nr:hypothetical protein [Clostridia bacterium]